MSDDQADVRSIETIDRFRSSLAGFASAARQAIDEGFSDLLRTQSWLELEQIPYWSREIRRREELLVRARSELYRIQVARTTVGDTEAKVRIRASLRAVEAAKEKLGSCKKWLVRLRDAQTLYRSSLSGLRQSVDHDIPHAVAILHRVTEDLEAYVGIPQVDVERMLAGPRSAPQESSDGSPDQPEQESLRRPPEARTDADGEGASWDSAENEADEEDRSWE